MIRVFTAVLATVLFSACSTKPLPQQFTGLNTYDIVQKIRCEMRSSVESAIVAALRQRGKFSDDQFAQENIQLANDISAGRKRISLLDIDDYPRNIRGVLERYEKAAVAYEFTFDITENNNISGNIDFVDKISRGTFTLGLTAKADRKRQNKRNFRIIDVFGQLARNQEMEIEICPGIKSGAIGYPITGEIGIRDQLSTFLSLNQSGNLIGGIPAKDSILAVPGPELVSSITLSPTLADTITFTTTIEGSANPTVSLTPITEKFTLMKASASFTANRSDIHKVIIVLALPPREDQELTIAEIRADAERERQREIENDEEANEVLRRLAN